MEVVKLKFVQNQKRLYDFVEKPEEQTEFADEKDFKAEFVTSFTDPFDLLDIKSEEVVIKVECIDDEDRSNGYDCDYEAAIPETQIDVKADKELKIDASGKPPSGYKLCPICGKILKLGPYYVHVS